MKVFVAGASGAIGKPLVSQLVAGGYQVVAMTRSANNVDALRAAGAEPVVADALDRDAVMQAVMRAEPEVIIHELTALTGVTNLKRFDEVFALTSRLRTEGTDYLMAAAQAAGTRRFIAQSYGNWTYARTGALIKAEDDPLDSTPPVNQTKSMAAIRHLERVIQSDSNIQGIALRYGNLYGPGTGFALDGDIVAMLRKRGFPIVGNGAGIWSFIHVNDAASAAVAAIQHGEPGAYNICDDEPAPVNVWLPALAKTVGAKPPFHIPVWAARFIVGDVAVSMMTQIRGASNAKAKRELDWQPGYKTWRDGFRTGLA
ncbi:MAG TPA: NAD(P)-dependent oxidoreductase [Ktedonobacterales bacterium]|jgi:nucleoside-diphosphate-sugar epimerase|nr:NAD(P)-dependent oxidoreductase [Ktedonobacterales bacterium]